MVARAKAHSMVARANAGDVVARATTLRSTAAPEGVTGRLGRPIKFRKIKNGS